MKNIKVVTKSRGFLKELYDYKNEKMEFNYQKSNTYETNSAKKLVLSKVIKSKLFDYIGVIQQIKVKQELKKDDILFSYNRFVKSSNSYVIYLENPLALVHYSTERPNTYLGNKNLKKLFDDPNLKGIVCLSNACYTTVKKIHSIPSRIKVEQIYPLVKSPNCYKEKKYNGNINCLFISSDFELKGGKEVIELFSQNSDENIRLKIITKVSSVPKEYLVRIENDRRISLLDFNLSKEELNNEYKRSHVLLNPSRQDSFSLVVLEAIKYGNVIISTDLYAIPEMVEDGVNGFLTEPKYRFFEKNNLPNKYVWNNRKQTIKSNFVDKNLVEFFNNKLKFLVENRNKLKEMSNESFKKSNNNNFGEKQILEKWNSVFDKISNGDN